MRFMTGIGGVCITAVHVRQRAACVDSRRVIWILLVLLAVDRRRDGGGAIARDRTKQLPGGGGAPEGAAERRRCDKRIERGVRDLRVDDMVTIDGTDFLCEGMVELRRGRPPLARAAASSTAAT